MRILAMTLAGAGLLAIATTATPAAAATTGIAHQAPIVLAQAEPKKESMTHKVERKVKKAWHSMVGYKFNVSCIVNKTTCTESGKDREDARGKCMAAHPLCMVSDAK